MNRPLALVLAVVTTLLFALSMTLFLTVSQFSSAVRAAITERLHIAADDVARSLGDAARVGVTIAASPPIDDLLERTLRSDPAIARVELRAPKGTLIAARGDLADAGDDARLRIDETVVSDYGTTLATVRVAGSHARFGRTVAATTRSLVSTALIAVVVGGLATSGAALGLVAYATARERALRQAIAGGVERELAAASAALDDLEALVS